MNGRQLVVDDVVLLRRQRGHPGQRRGARTGAGAAAGAEDDGPGSVAIGQAQVDQLVLEEIDFGLVGVAGRRP